LEAETIAVGFLNTPSASEAKNSASPNNIELGAYKRVENNCVFATQVEAVSDRLSQSSLHFSQQATFLHANSLYIIPLIILREGMALNSVFSWFMQKRFHQMELFMKYPHEVQTEVLNYLLQMGASTEWGKAHGYKDITNVNRFRNSVPLQTYEDLKPYVKRLQAGEQGLIWPTEISWFAKSSGTTSDKSKFIPVSREALDNCHYKAGKDLLAVYDHNHPNNNVYGGKSLAIGGSSQINALNKDSYYGDLSAIIIKNLPFWVEFKRVPERDIALMDEWETKIERMARSVMDEDVSNMAGVPSWTLLLLKRILELKGAKQMSEVWPNFELYMHGGISFAPYRKHFHTLIGGYKLQCYENYNASEGFFGIQDRAGADDMLLMLDYGIFYEFIPLANSLEEQPKTILLEDVEIHKVYELVISTNAGLWRYRLGDTIEFTSTKPYRIRVAGRTKSFINAFGEELMVDNAEKAIALTCEKLDCRVKDFTAGPIYMDLDSRGAHQWLIEFEQEPLNKEEFAGTLDGYLKTLNSDYEAKRTADLSLQKPQIHFLPSGTFYNWLKHKGKLGGQHKVPRLSNDRAILDDILAYNQLVP